MSDQIDQEVVEQLRASKEIIGPIEKIVLDVNGHVVDGHHREVADPNWPKEVNPKLKTEEDCLVFMVAKNWHRTNKDENWKRNVIGKLAKLGNDVQAIAQKTGLKERTIYYYLPSEYKKPEPVQLASARSALNRESQETKPPQAMQCAACPDGTYYAKPFKVQGREYPLCPKCFNLANGAQPETFYRTHILPRLPQAEKGIPEIPKKELKPRDFDTWTEKKAHMQVQHSEVETEIRTELTALNIPPMTDKWICLWGTNPDGQYEKQKVCYFYHGPPHDKGKALDRDPQIKAKLETQGWTVLVFRHGEGTPKDWARQVQEALKF
jgi:hypothetical protein